MREIEEISVIHSGCSRLTGTTIDNIPKLLFGTNLIYYLRLRECYSTPPKSPYLFDDRFGRPARGNDKGNFEGMVGYTRRNFMGPAPC